MRLYVCVCVRLKANNCKLIRKATFHEMCRDLWIVLTYIQYSMCGLTPSPPPHVVLPPPPLFPFFRRPCLLYYSTSNLSYQFYHNQCIHKKKLLLLFYSLAISTTIQHSSDIRLTSDQHYAHQKKSRGTHMHSLQEAFISVACEQRALRSFACMCVYVREYTWVCVWVCSLVFQEGGVILLSLAYALIIIMFYVRLQSFDFTTENKFSQNMHTAIPYIHTKDIIFFVSICTHIAKVVHIYSTTKMW